MIALIFYHKEEESQSEMLQFQSCIWNFCINFLFLFRLFIWIVQLYYRYAQNLWVNTPKLRIYRWSNISKKAIQMQAFCCIFIIYVAYLYFRIQFRPFLRKKSKKQFETLKTFESPISIFSLVVSECFCKVKKRWLFGRNGHSRSSRLAALITRQERKQLLFDISFKF